MGKNSAQYDKVYQSKKRKELIGQLGGQCKVCGIKDDLIIHRIFSLYNGGQIDSGWISTLDGNKKVISEYTPISTAVLKERAKLLRNNKDNMILLCYSCYMTLIRIHGRKNRIGRKEIAHFRGDF